MDDIRRGEELAAAQWVKASVADFLAFCVDVGKQDAVSLSCLSKRKNLFLPDCSAFNSIIF